MTLVAAAENDSKVEDKCPDNPSSSPTSGNPVILATGEKIFPKSDASSSGLYGMTTA